MKLHEGFVNFVQVNTGSHDNPSHNGDSERVTELRFQSQEGQESEWTKKRTPTLKEYQEEDEGGGEQEICCITFQTL
jgi:hypothetical protein